jgi:hypothetical protein
MKYAYLILLFSSLLIHRVGAQDTLNYNAFITNIKNNYPIILKANNFKEIGDFTYKAAKGGFDPVVSTSFDNKFYSGKNYYSLLDAKIRKPLFASQFISAGYQYAQGAFVNPEEQTSVNGMPFLGMEAALLQGLTFDMRRADLLKAKNYKAYFESESKLVTNEVLYTASISFIDWIYSCKELSLYNYFTFLALQRFNGIKSLSDVGEYAGIDTVEAAILYQSRYMDMQSVQIENQKMVNSIQTFNWINPEQSSDLSRKIFLVDSLEYYFEKSKSMLSLYLLDNDTKNPVIEKYEAFQKVLEIERRYRGELIKPKLDVSYNFLAGDPISGPMAFNTNNYKWGLNLSFPMFLRTSRNEYKISKLNAMNNKLDLNTKSNELQFKLNVIKRNIEIVIDQLLMAEKNVTFSKLLLDSERIKFEAGESSLFLLNTRESKWMESELKLADYKTKFIKFIFELVYVSGSMNYTM